MNHKINLALIKRVPAGELSLNDKVLFEYIPSTQPQEDFQKEIKNIIQEGIRDFWAPRIDASMIDRKIIYQPGMKPAKEDSSRVWYDAAKKFMPEFGSRLFEPREHQAQMALLLKFLVERGGYSTKEAWAAVCDNSYRLGNFDGIRQEKTGKREIGGWYDLGNMFKLTYSESEGYQLFGGAWCTDPKYHPVTKRMDVGYSFSYCSDTVGKVLFEREPK